MLEKVGTFILTDGSLDRHSERVLPKGVQLASFRKNPVMFYNHHRSRGYSDAASKQVLPIGKWKNIKKEEERITADAYIDMEDEFAAKVGDKIKNGVLQAVSIGYRGLAFSDDAKDKLPGQRGMTVTKAEIREASIVDIPANANALMISKSIREKNLSNGELEKKQLQFVKTFHTKHTIMELMTRFKNWVEKSFGQTFEQAEEAMDFVEKQSPPDNELLLKVSEKNTKDLLAFKKQAATHKTALEQLTTKYDQDIKALKTLINELKGQRSSTPSTGNTATDLGDGGQADSDTLTSKKGFLQDYLDGKVA